MDRKEALERFERSLEVHRTMLYSGAGQAAVDASKAAALQDYETVKLDVAYSMLLTIGEVGRLTTRVAELERQVRLLGGDI